MVKKTIQPADLSTRYNLSVKQVYKIIEEQRGYHIRRIQPGLF
ncbi:Mor transcription activator family protein [Neptuniibacter sp.]|nr:hypothetical protein [Neptuniibacter sp.]